MRRANKLRPAKPLKLWGDWGTKKKLETACSDWRPFWVVCMPAYRSCQLDQNVCPSIKYLVISHGRFPTDWTIFSPKQNQNIKEALTGVLSILNIWPENRAIVLSLNRKWPITVVFMGERLWHWILSACFGKSMIFTVFALAKEEMPSSKTCEIVILPLKSIIDDSISEMLSLSYTAMELRTETVSFLGESPPQFSLSLSVRKGIKENSALHRSVSDCGLWIAHKDPA